MHPEIAPTIAAQHHQSLRREAAQNRRLPDRNRSRGFRRHRPGWSVSWSRTILSADATQRRGSSLLIIITARGPADGLELGFQVLDLAGMGEELLVGGALADAGQRPADRLGAAAGNALKLRLVHASPPRVSSVISVTGET
jgi:hypothetical protein